jgi:prophage antirepressor-like protein
MASTTETTTKVAYVFQDVNGWYICDDAAEMLDTRGTAYPSKNAAIASLRQRHEDGHTDYTHYRTGVSKTRKL